MRGGSQRTLCGDSIDYPWRSAKDSIPGEADGLAEGDWTLVKLLVPHTRAANGDTRPGASIRQGKQRGARAQRYGETRRALGDGGYSVGRQCVVVVRGSADERERGGDEANVVAGRSQVSRESEATGRRRMKRAGDQIQCCPGRMHIWWECGVSR